MRAGVEELHDKWKKFRFISLCFQLMERFLCTVADLFDVGRKTPRIGDSVLRLLPQILSCLHVLEMCPDSSPALSRLLLQLTKVITVNNDVAALRPSASFQIVNSRLSSPARIKSSLNSLCSLLGCSRESQTWHSAARLVGYFAILPLVY